jgi:hypothetical protein
MATQNDDNCEKVVAAGPYEPAASYANRILEWKQLVLDVSMIAIGLLAIIMLSFLCSVVLLYLLKIFPFAYFLAAVIALGACLFLLLLVLVILTSLSSHLKVHVKADDFEGKSIKID